MSELHDRDNQALSEQVSQLKSVVERQDAVIGLLADAINRLSSEIIGRATHQDVMNAIGEYVPSEIRGSSIDGAGDILVNMGGRAVWDTPDIGASSGSFTGIYWFKGKRYELGGTAKAYWYHNEASGSGAWSDGPMPDMFPDKQYWRITAECDRVEYILC